MNLLCKHLDCETGFFAVALSVWDFAVDRWSAHALLDPVYVVIAMVFALTLCVIPQIWRITRQAATIVHEAGHALMAAVVGRRIMGIKLHTDTSGVMISRGKPKGIGMLAVCLIGYPAPGVLAGLMAIGVSIGHAGAALSLYQALMLYALLLCRNVVGILSCLASLLMTGALWFFGTAELVTFIAMMLAVFYILAGLRCLIDVMRVHSSVPDDDELTTDASQARQMVGLLPSTAKFYLVVMTAAWVVSAVFVIEAVVSAIGWT